MRIFMVCLIVVALSSIAVAQSTSMESLASPILANVTVFPQTLTVPINSTSMIDVVLDQVPSTGFSYTNITVGISNSSVAEILSISFPSWTTLASNSTLPSSIVWFKVGDILDYVKAGDTNVVLATLTIKGSAEGSANITIMINAMDDDYYTEIKDQIGTISGKIEVITGPPPIDGVQSKDLNGDGKFEDVDGDGKFTFGDVVFFFYNFDKPEIKNYPQYYDFNGDQSVNFGDVIALFRMMP